MAWLTDWTFRKSKAIIGSDSGNQTDYQMLGLTLHYGSGTDDNSNIYLNEHSKVDFSDIRFTSNDGSTVLSYWIKSVIESDQCEVVVKIASLPTIGTTIYVYYGNAVATAVSSGTDTFIFFEDFLGDTLPEDWTWETSGTGGATGSIEIADSVLKILAPQPSSGARTTVVYSPYDIDPTQNLALEAKTYSTKVGYWFYTLCFLSQADSNQIGWAFVRPSEFSYERRFYYADTYAQDSTEPPFDEWVTGQITGYNNTWKLYLDDLQIIGDQSWTPDDVARFMFLSYKGYNYGGIAELYVDWVFVRNFIVPEPTWSATGAEEIGTADFIGTPLSGIAPVTVQFSDLSTGVQTSWLWDFGDGETSAEQNPSHEYNRVGNYTVSLTVSNDYGSDELIKSVYVNVFVISTLNLPDYDERRLSFGPGVIYIGVAGQTPLTDIGAVNEGMSLSHTTESIALEQGSMSINLREFITEENAIFTFQKLEWVTTNFDKFAGAGHVDGDRFTYGGDINYTEASLRLVHQLPPAQGSVVGSTIIIDIWQARSNSDFDIDFPEDIEDIEFHYKALPSTVDWSGNALDTDVRLYRITIQGAI